MISATMTSSARLLCLDTSTSTARVAIVDGEGAAVARAEATAERHSAHVLKLCDEVLRAAGLRPDGLDGIAVGGGPGSFTGLRVGLSVAKGLALATGKPLLLISSLQALALDIALHAASSAAVVVPCIDAGKGEVYAFACAVDAARTVAAGGEPWRLSPDALAVRLAELPGALVAGNGAERHAVALDAAFGAVSCVGVRRLSIAGPTALSIGALALPRFGRGEADDLDKSVPFYGRLPDITTKKRLANG
jgi:tRNA threonylcarbamoyladenosine biosynthesis protein TsaB